MSNQAVVKASDCYARDSFSASGRTFTKVEPGTYSDGKITVYCDQQDSTSWAARIGNIRTGYFWFPEYAVEELVSSIEAAK